MISRIALDIHSIIIVNLCFSEIRDAVFPFFVYPVTTVTIYLVKYLSFLKPVNCILPSLFAIVRRNVILNFFLGIAISQEKTSSIHTDDNQVLHQKNLSDNGLAQ